MMKQATNTMTIKIEESGYIALKDMQDIIKRAEITQPDYEVLGMYRLSENELVLAIRKRD